MGSKWQRFTLREAGVTLLDCEHRTPPKSPEGYPYIAIPQLDDGRINLEKVRLISEDDFIEWTRKADPQPDDIILSRRCNPGETAYVPDNLKCALGQNLVLLRADGQSILPKFLRYLVRSPDWWEQIHKYINVGAVFDSLKCRDIPKFELPVPPLPEQRAIAHVLGTLDDKIELNRKMNETLEGIATALFKSWFVDFDPVHAKMDDRRPAGMDDETAELFPDELVWNEELGKEVPKGWKVGTLKDAIEIFDKIRVPLNKKQRAEIQGNYRYYGAAGIMDYVDDYLFNGIYLLSGEDGSVADEAGFPILQYVWGRFWVNNHAHVLRGKNGISTEFLYLFLQRTNIKPFITGAVQPKLSQTNLKKIEMVLPPEKVSARFSKIINPLFIRYRENTDENLILSQIRDTLLPKLISGQIRIEESERFLKEREIGEVIV